MRKLVLVSLLSLLALTATGCLVVLGGQDFPSCCRMAMDAAAHDVTQDDSELQSEDVLEERSDDTVVSPDSQQ